MNVDLTTATGIGPATAEELLERYDSLEDILSAHIRSLAETPYLSAKSGVHLKVHLLESSPESSHPEILSPDGSSILDIHSAPDEYVSRTVGELAPTTSHSHQELRRLVRRSYGCRQLDIEPYREAFEVRCQQVDEDIPEYRGGYPVEDVQGLSKEALNRRNESHRQQQMRKREEKKRQERRRYLRAFLYSEHDFATKVEAIIAAHVSLGPTLNRGLTATALAAIIGCSTGYASDFKMEVVDEEPVVVKKEYAAKYEQQRLETYEKNQIKERDGNTCVRCSGDDNLVVHHITPIVDGGESDSSNLVTLCRECHGEVHENGHDWGSTIYDDNEEFWGWVGDDPVEQSSLDNFG